MNPAAPGPAAPGGAAVKGVAKKWLVKGADKQPAKVAKGSEAGGAPAGAVPAKIAPAPAEKAPGVAGAVSVKKMAGGFAPQPAAAEPVKGVALKAGTVRKMAGAATAAGEPGEVRKVTASATLRESGDRSPVPLNRSLGLSKTAARLSTPPAPPSSTGAEAKKIFGSSSPNVLVRPSKPLPSAAAPEPVVAAASAEEDEPPPPVPAFEEPPPVPVFEVEVAPEESDSMLDDMFDHIAQSDKPVAAVVPAKAVRNGSALADGGMSDSFLDSVFAQIKTPVQSAKVAVPVAVEGDVTDSFLDSVFNDINVEPVKKVPPSLSLHEDVEEEPTGAPDDDGDLLGAMMGEIEATKNPHSRSSQLILDEAQSVADQAEEARRAEKEVKVLRRASVATAPVAPASPAMRPGPLNSPGFSRPRVKSFAPSAIAPLDIATIRASGHSSKAVSEPQEPDRQGNEAKVRSVMAQLKKMGSGVQLVSRVLYDLGQANPPSMLRLWGNKALLVVAGDKVCMRTLNGEENLGNISETGVKVAFSEPGTDRLWLASKEPTIKVYELLKPSVVAHTITSHSEWVAAVELFAPGIVATASADKTVRVWRLPSLKSMVCKGHLDFVTCMAVVADPTDDSAPALLASGSCDKTIRLWNVTTTSAKNPVGIEVSTLFGHTGWVWSLCCDGKGSLWSSGRDCSLRNWNTKTGECVKEVKLDSSVTKLVAHDKTLFAVDEALVITMLRKGKVFKKLSGHTGKIRCLAFLGDSIFSSGDDRGIRRWNAQNGSCIEVLKGHTDSVVDLRAVPEYGKLFSASDDGTVREWIPAALDGVLQPSSASSNAATRQEVEVQRLRKLMRDPTYWAAATCQAVVRMRFVRDSIRSNHVLMYGAKSRYRNICILSSFEQNHLACITQFMSGFLVPVQSYMKKHGEHASENVFKPEQVTGFADALSAAYLMHSSVLEKLDFQKQTYPFCIETGHILEAEHSSGQLYMLLLDFIPILVDWSTSGLDGTRSAFFDRVEADEGLRLDHGACRLLLWGLTRYWSQSRLPLQQVLRFSPTNGILNDAPSLCTALSRSIVLEGVIRITCEATTARSRFVHTLHRYIPTDVPAVEKKWYSEAGPLVCDEQAHLKVKSRSMPVRILVFANVMLVLTDTGSAKKDKLVELLPLNMMTDVLLQVDPKEMVIRAKAIETTNAEVKPKKSLSMSASSGSLPNVLRTLLFVFENPKRSAQLCKEIDQAMLLAKHGVTRQKLDAQVELFKRQHPSASPLPEFPVLLMQYLSSAPDETLATIFNFPCSEMKVISVAEAFDSSKDPAQRAAALCAALPSTGVQNVFAALAEFFLRLPNPLFEPDLRKSILACTNAVEVRKILSQPTLRASRDLLSYFFWFLSERLLVAMQRSEFEDPLAVLAAIVCPLVFWDQREARRMIMDVTRAAAACKLFMSNYMEIFPRIEMPNMLVLSESKAQVELAKRLAKEKYEAEEQERNRVVAMREQQDLEKVKTSVAEAEGAKQAKLDLEKMVVQQRAEFEKKKEEMNKVRTQGESAFEALRRQQAEAKARANAKLQMMKDRGLGGGAAGPQKSLSDASLASLLSDMGVSQSASPSPSSSGSITPMTSGGMNSSMESFQQLPAREVPMIKIPVLELTPQQQRLIVVVPKLPPGLIKLKV